MVQLNQNTPHPNSSRARIKREIHAYRRREAIQRRSKHVPTTDASPLPRAEQAPRRRMPPFGRYLDEKRVISLSWMSLFAALAVRS